MSLGIPITMYTSGDAEARRFSGSSVSFSRSVVRTRISTSTPRAPRVARAPSGHKVSTDSKQPAMKGGFWNSGGKQKSLKTKRQSASLSAPAQRGNTLLTKKTLKVQRHEKRFKTQPAPVPGLKKTDSGRPASRIARNKAFNKTYSDHAIYSRARNVNHTTYHTRRDSYYDRVGWGTNTPSYVFVGAPSYGLWDTTYLYSNLLNAQLAAQMAHNYQNDADYRRWRRAADQAALENAELRAQLAAMDAAKAQYAGTPINPGYLPEGVDPDIALASGARSAALPEFRVCTGGMDGAYFMITTGVMAPNAEYVNMIPVTTAGTGETLRYIQTGKCDGGWAQANGYWNFIEDNSTLNLPFGKLFSPYREAAHMICNAKAPSKLSKLDEDHKIYFPAGSGAEVTYRDWIGEDDDYADIPNSLTHPVKLKVASNSEALLKVSQDKNACMLYVAAPGATEFMKNAERMAVTLGIKLIDLNDGDLLDTTDPSGDDVYAKVQIDSSVYPQLSRMAGAVYGSGDIHTLNMNADFLFGEAWKKKHPEVYAKVAMKVLTMEDRIKLVVRP